MFLYWIRYMSRVKRLEILAKQKKTKTKNVQNVTNHLLHRPQSYIKMT
jgi:hypothetical protein